MDTRTTLKTALATGLVPSTLVAPLEAYLATCAPLTRGEGNSTHVNVFFLPLSADGFAYLGHHRKADDWIPPGGHIEPGETPTQACVREMNEELGYQAQTKDFILAGLTYKAINRPASHCLGHYDLWYVIHLPTPISFAYDSREYYAAQWFPAAEAPAAIAHNQDFATMMQDILNKESLL